jgi:aminoglycoside phosphotransferase (APT) family kinase protein
MMHPEQHHVSAETVRLLVRDQLPAYDGRPVRPLRTTGTVNAIFRIGDDLSARFPLLGADPDAVLAELTREADAMRQLASVSPVPVPQVVAIGRPGPGYPLPWSVQDWLPGHDALAEDPGGSPGFADDLAVLLQALRGADSGGHRFAGEGRGGHLPDHDAWMQTCFAESRGLVDVEPLQRLWAALRSLPGPEADVMTHGDLNPPNLLVRSGRLAGVLDGGGFAPADQALDLVAAWHLLDAGPRARLRSALGCEELEWRRGMAWALQQAMGLVWYYVESNPAMARWGRRTLDRLLEE